MFFLLRSTLECWLFKFMTIDVTAKWMVVAKDRVKGHQVSGLLE